ncbi:MAG: XRE family transcriptional regulator [Candidatus Omnitrophica bacterium]|nr:XRE family transcriptional regulator [Candidatus Omnitrophota bacterium]
MIKNSRQYEYTKNKLEELKRDLEEVSEKYSKDKGKFELLSVGLVEHIAQLQNEINEYEDMISKPLPAVLHAQTSADISRMIIRLRLARKLTQKKLAELMGCRQADISRLEREEYHGYSFNMLRKLVDRLNAKIEINFIPSDRKKPKTRVS